MYIITYKGKAATLAKIYKIEGKNNGYYNNDHETIENSYLAAPSKRKAMALYLYHCGFTWAERVKGIEATHVSLVRS